MVMIGRLQCNSIKSREVRMKLVTEDRRYLKYNKASS